MQKKRYVPLDTRFLQDIAFWSEAFVTASGAAAIIDRRLALNLCASGLRPWSHALFVSFYFRACDFREPPVLRGGVIRIVYVPAHDS